MRKHGLVWRHGAARFAGICRRCTRRFDVGDQVYTAKNQGALHESCFRILYPKQEGEAKSG